MASDKILIAISVVSIQREPYISPKGGFCNSVDLKAESKRADLSFTFHTALLDAEMVRPFELLRLHGSTVVELPSDAQLWNEGRGGWKDRVVVHAIERINKRYSDGAEVDMTEIYDTAFAEQILVEINKQFPHPVQIDELKHTFESEPSDSTLMTALAGLLRDGFIEGRTLFSSTTAQRRLTNMANIQITLAGRRHLVTPPSETSVATIIQGDQFNNYGQTGAMGHHSTGALNYQQQWAATASQVDLSALVSELQMLKAEMMKTARTTGDFQHLGLVAEAEQYAQKRDGPRVMEVLSKSGKWLFDFATHVGTDIPAKLIAKATGLEP